MPAPKIFISYSHDSQQHKDWALRLATSMRAHGIDAILDQWDLVPGQDLAEFMAKGIRTADRVVMICSEAYVAKAEAGIGGVGYERLIVTAEVVAAIDTIKFIPVVRNNACAHRVPNFLGPRLYVDFSEDANYDEKFEGLAREILGIPAAVKPALGENPFKGEVIASKEPVRIAGPSGATSAGMPILSGEWFQSQHNTAALGITHLHQGPDGELPLFGDIGAMEVRLGLHSGLNKTQIELLNAVRAAEIHTFGWSIAPLLEGRPEYKPRPFGDGIRAEVSINDQGGRNSYDYWAARKSGDFYLLGSFFEDRQDAGVLYFNTRIVRVTEALLFAGKLYASLGATADAKISARFTHTGLTARTLKAAGQNRRLPRRSKSDEAVSETETVIVLGDIQRSLVDEVRRVCEPMFMLFDFQEFAPEIYEDIVRRFENGEST
ncbi:toll/interleukin-1 receptor domain-containing protein [Variovorax sp. tm]|uniref:toll/interleukin-1 receptor domain-containing protein n=1 Tax=Variovorax atrisoli TaxID=3394203 RepID=UPI003A80C07B